MTLLIASACAQNPVTGERDFVLMSEAQEKRMGARSHEALIQQMPPVDDDDLQAYVDAIGQELADASHRPDIDYTVTVIDDDQINAFALPGGYVYVTRGIMAYFNSEAELAGVLGHEIGHVTARHGVRRHATATTTGLLATAIGEGAGDLGANLFSVAGMAVLQGYSRQYELQADELGAQYLARTGYPPLAMLEVLGVLHDQQRYRMAGINGDPRGGYHGLFDSHPDNDTRRQDVIHAARKIDGAGERGWRRDPYLDAIDGMIYGIDTARRGRLLDDRFAHPATGSTLMLPRDWRARRTPGALLLRAGDDAAQAEVRMRANDDDRSPREILAAILEDAQVLDHQAIDDAAYPAHTARVRAATGLGTRTLRVTAITAGDVVWLIAGAARDESDFTAYDSALLELARGLRPIRDEERAAAAPVRLVMDRAGPDTTYAPLAEQAPAVIDDAEDRLRLMNGDWPDGEPSPGERIKTLVQDPPVTAN